MNRIAIVVLGWLANGASGGVLAAVPAAASMVAQVPETPPPAPRERQAPEPRDPEPPPQSGHAPLDPRQRVEELWQELGRQRAVPPAAAAAPSSSTPQPAAPLLQGPPSPPAPPSGGNAIPSASPPQSPPAPLPEPLPTLPPPPDAPAEAHPLPPVEEPFRTSVDRRDLLQRVHPPSPLTGFWMLRRIVRPGAIEPQRATGWLAFGDRHLMLQLQIEGDNPRLPFLQSGTRRYSVRGDTIVTTSLLGLSNDADGDILLEQQGLVEVRRFTLAGTVLRILHEDGGSMEFVRVE